MIILGKTQNDQLTICVRILTAISDHIDASLLKVAKELTGHFIAIYFIEILLIYKWW